MTARHKGNKKNFISWSNIDIKLVKCGVLPQGRSIRACSVFCRRHNIEFMGKRQIDELDQLVKRIEERQHPATNQSEKEFSMDTDS